MILETLLLTTALSLDAFLTAFAYGSNKLHLPGPAIVSINVICTFTLGLSYFAGTFLEGFLSESWTQLFGCALLLIIGVIKLLDGTTKDFVRKHTDIHKEFGFSMFNFKFILRLYAAPELADTDLSQDISLKESVSLAIALSLDSLTIGLSAAFGDFHGGALLICSFIVGMLLTLLGNFLGRRIFEKLPFNVSWLSGLFLILLAVYKRTSV